MIKMLATHIAQNDTLSELWPINIIYMREMAK